MHHTNTTITDLSTLTDAQQLAHFSSITAEQAENDAYDRFQAAHDTGTPRASQADLDAALARLAANPVQFAAPTKRAVRGRR